MADVSFSIKYCQNLYLIFKFFKTIYLKYMEKLGTKFRNRGSERI